MGSSRGFDPGSFLLTDVLGMVSRTIIPKTFLNSIPAQIKCQNELYKGKALIILGPRQVGKTTLAKELVALAGRTSKWLNGDESDVRDSFANVTSTSLKALAGNAEILVLDEAQRIENIELCIKLLVDSFPRLQVIATGSSSFELANRIKEPLTGRKWENLLLPLSFEELQQYAGLLEERRLLNHRLIFGSYPDVLMNPGEEARIIRQLADSYLYKDIFTWERINKPDRLEKLVKALALQIGREVSYSELGETAGLDNETVEKYLSLLEKAFVVFRLHAFSRNVRNEIRKSRKVYFYDVGIRNAVINNFTSPGQRTDIGALWENYLISERIKWAEDHDHFANRYFWRTTQQQEIDYIEEYDGILHAFEFKWNQHRDARIPKTFRNAYPNSETATVNPQNYEHFLMGKKIAS